MKVYRVPARDDFNEHHGYEYFTTKKAAEKCLSENIARYPHNTTELEIELENVPLTKKGLIGILTQWGSHPDNG